MAIGGVMGQMYIRYTFVYCNPQGFIPFFFHQASSVELGNSRTTMNHMAEISFRTHKRIPVFSRIYFVHFIYFQIFAQPLNPNELSALNLGVTSACALWYLMHKCYEQILIGKGTYDTIFKKRNSFTIQCKWNEGKVSICTFSMFCLQQNSK